MIDKCENCGNKRKLRQLLCQDCLDKQLENAKPGSVVFVSEKAIRKVKMPEKLKIACFDIVIEKMNNKAAAAHSRYGEFSSLELCIRVEEGLNDIKTVDTLIHEIGHAIYWAYGMEDEDKEERIVSTMSTAWTQIYRDNPQLLKFIQCKLGKS